MIYHSIRMNGSTIIPPSPRNPAGQAAGGADDLIELLRTLADPIRLRLLRLLELQPQNGNGGLSVGELGDILKLPQSTVSRHLKTLTDAHITDVRREGTSMFYRLSEGGNSPTQAASKQLRSLARSHLENDPIAKADTHRLTAILRRRESFARPADSFFGKHAPRWDQIRAQWFGDTFHLEALLALLDPNWTIADIGTGTGAMLPLLAPHVKQVIAIDPSPAMLKAARSRIKDQNLENVDLRQGSVGGLNGETESLPIEDGSVDVALLALVLAYTPDPSAALQEIKRILKPGGIVLIIDLQPHAVELFRTELNHRWMGFPQEDLIAWLKEAGFHSPRWHPLVAKTARSKNGAPRGDTTPVPDLFALRAQAGK
jgi:ArsR family transcriptional regulator